jgi:hypothetical protein
MSLRRSTFARMTSIAIFFVYVFCIQPSPLYTHVLPVAYAEICIASHTRKSSWQMLDPQYRIDIEKKNYMIEGRRRREKRQREEEDVKKRICYIIL